MSDLYPRWLGTRELLLNGRNPYSPEITREIQQGYYGRPLDHSRPSDPIDEQRFAYPLFVVFLLAPTVYLPFIAVKWLFTAILSLAAGWTVFLWFRIIGLKTGRGTVLTGILFALATVPYTQGIQLQQLGVLVAFFLAAASYALATERFAVAGLLLAAAIIKPQLSMNFVGCVLLWSLWEWRSRKGVVISFFASLIALVLASEALLPRWDLPFIAGIRPYLSYTQATTGIDELVGAMGGAVALLLMALISAFAAWRAKSRPVGSDDFILAISLLLVFTCVAIPSLAPHNEILLVPPYLLLVKERKRIWRSGRTARALWSAAWLTAAWPWLVGSFLATTLVFNRPIDRLWNLPLATNPLIPVTAFTALIPLLVAQVVGPAIRSPQKASMAKSGSH